MTEARTEAAPARTVAAPPASKPPEPPRRVAASRVPSIIVAALIAAVGTLSIYYLVRGQPLLVQGEADATRFDIAARVDGRVGEIPVVRGQNVDANAVLVRIDNPETIAKHEQTLAAKIVAAIAQPYAIDGAQAVITVSVLVSESLTYQVRVDRRLRSGMVAAGPRAGSFRTKGCCELSASRDIVHSVSTLGPARRESNALSSA